MNMSGPRDCGGGELCRFMVDVPKLLAIQERIC